MVTSCVNGSWLNRSLGSRKMIVSYELKFSQCHFEMKVNNSDLVASVKIQVKCKSLRRASLISYQSSNYK